MSETPKEPEKCLCTSDWSSCAVCTREYNDYHTKMAAREAEKAVINAYYAVKDRVD